MKKVQIKSTKTLIFIIVFLIIVLLYLFFHVFPDNAVISVWNKKNNSTAIDLSNIPCSEEGGLLMGCGKRYPHTTHGDILIEKELSRLEDPNITREIKNNEYYLIITKAFYSESTGILTIFLFNNAGKDVTIEKITFISEESYICAKTENCKIKKYKEQIFEVKLNEFGLRLLPDEVWLIPSKPKLEKIGVISKDNIIILE